MPGWILGALFFAAVPVSAADSPVQKILVRDMAPEDLEGLPPGSTAKTIADRLDPKQQQAALVRLRDLERGLPQQAPALGELGDAYLALNSPADAARVAARLQELEPNKADGFRIAAHSLY